MDLTECDKVEILVLVDNVVDTLSSTPFFVTRETAILRRSRGKKNKRSKNGMRFAIRS